MQIFTMSRLVEFSMQIKTRAPWSNFSFITSWKVNQWKYEADLHGNNGILAIKDSLYVSLVQ